LIADIGFGGVCRFAVPFAKVSASVDCLHLFCFKHNLLLLRHKTRYLRSKENTMRLNELFITVPFSSLIPEFWGTFYWHVLFCWSYFGK